MSLPISEPSHAYSAGYRLSPQFEAFPAMTPGGMQSMQNPSLPPNMNMPGPPLPSVPSPMHPPVPVPQGSQPLTLPAPAPTAKEGIKDKIMKNKVAVIIGVIAVAVILYLLMKRKGKKKLF